MLIFFLIWYKNIFFHIALHYELWRALTSIFNSSAEFRKTCEELALLGYSEPDVYLIDIDGNGRFPPAHVKCEFQADETKTIVEHNLPSQVVSADRSS